MFTPLRLLLMTLWAVSIVIAYYSAPTHGYEFSDQFLKTLTTRGLGIYLVVVGIAYGLWRIVTMNMKVVSIRPVSMVGLFYGHLLLASLIYFSTLAAFTSADGMIMWGRIIMLTLVPLSILLTAYVLGRAIVRYVLPEEKNAELIVLLSIGIGFTALISVIFILSNSIGYTSLAVIGVFIAAIIGSYRELLPLWTFFTTPLAYAHSTETGLQMRRTIAELSYIVVSFLLIVSVISCFRAAPIGWDDSGVYMNWPRTMALSGELMEGGMYAWQLITGIGYLMGRAAQAFMINQLGSVLIIISSVVGYRLLLSGRKYSLPYGVIAAAIFLAMPMIVFQQAKDMKLDPALLGLSMTALFALFEALRRIVHGEWKEVWKLLVLVGVIIGGVFAVKFTSLMLILAALALLVFTRLGAMGLLWYTLLVSGIFTLGWLWKMMNVVISKDPQMLLIAGAIMSGVGVLCLIQKIDRETWESVFKESLALLAGVLLALSPWLVKNAVDTISADQKLSVTTLLNGYIDDSHAFRPDYTKIYTLEQIKAGERSVVEGSVNEEGLAGNEDLGRYFGYEKGLNNYLKLPINLTLQSNQNGEYTEIGYWYLVFIPVIFLWFPWQRKYLASGAIALLVLFMAIYYYPLTNSFLSEIFSTPRFPLAYIYVLAPIVLGLTGILYWLQSDRRNDITRFVAVMSAVYGTLFLVSAFGIVWYGILIYPLMLAAIFLAMTDAEEELSSAHSPWITVFMGVTVTLLAVYFFRSALPHGWNNLLSVTYPEYKSGKMDETLSIFAYRAVADIRNIASLNIDPVKGADFLTKLTSDDLIQKISYPGVQKALTDFGANASLTALALRAPQLAEVVQRQTGDPAQKQVAISELTTISKEALQRLNTILVPGDLKNEGKIYRIGTFFTYYISENQKRYLEDSLIFAFDQWFYDPVPEVTIERMKKLGIRHLLIDLNAATIDRDPRRALTKRFERLLLTTRAKNLSLVSTDSVCLETALRMPTLTDTEFLALAGVNYESYTTNEDGSERRIYRWEKLASCRQKLLELYNSWAITPEVYPHLMPMKNALDQLVTQSAGVAPSPQKVGEILEGFIPDRTWMVLFQIP